MAIIETVSITVSTKNFLAANILASRLVEGPTYMRDADILIPLQNTDCVAAGVRYHFSCRRNYVQTYECKLTNDTKSPQGFV